MDENNRSYSVIYLIPMAGAGSRFSAAGYHTHKPVIPITDRRTHEKIPMVVAATRDLPHVNAITSNIIYIDRDFHKTDGVERTISSYFSHAKFISVDHLTDGQACTCLLAKDAINNTQELFIAGCDNGMIYSVSDFDCAKKDADALIFTYRNNPAVLVNPEAYGWVIVDDNNFVLDVSVKKAISNTPLNDHAIVASFWFKQGTDFVAATERMIAMKDTVNNEYYVDQAMKHALQLGLKVKVFEVEYYIGWGTPADYEQYEQSLAYWSVFAKEEGLI